MRTKLYYYQRMFSPFRFWNAPAVSARVPRAMGGWRVFYGATFPVPLALWQGGGSHGQFTATSPPSPPAGPLHLPLQCHMLHPTTPRHQPLASSFYCSLVFSPLMALLARLRSLSRALACEHALALLCSHRGTMGGGSEAARPMTMTTTLPTTTVMAATMTRATPKRRQPRPVAEAALESDHH